MPEGDTIFRAAHRLRSVLAGQDIVSAGGSEQLPVADSLEGSRVTAIESRGKHLLVHFAHDRILHTHLGMKGSWHVYRIDESQRRPNWQAAVTLSTSQHRAVCYQPKLIELLSGKMLRRHEWLNRLGPDLLGPPADDAHVLARFRTRNHTPVGVVVMDQSVVCGIGNIYKSEVLFLNQIHPLTLVAELSDEQITGLVQTAIRLLRSNLTGGKRRTRFRPTGPSVWVYRRSGDVCLKCDAIIRMVRQGPLRRSTYYCDTCQPPGQADSTDRE